MQKLVQKKFLLIIIIALVIVLAGGGWLIFTRFNHTQKKPSSLSTSDILSAPSAIPSAVAAVSAYEILSQRKLSSKPQTTTSPRQSKTNKTVQDSSTNQPKSPGIPVWFSIPKIGVQASVEYAGLDADGAMEVPKSWWTVGWYKLGYKVGDLGSAVISGHYDTNTGAPAVFYKLSRLGVGDLITVKVDNGGVYTYRVINKQSYPFDQLPLQQIFASSGKAQLNLITCGGEWNRINKNYSQRVVIYSELVN